MADSLSEIRQAVALKLFEEAYVPSARRPIIAASAWPKVSQGVRDAYLAKADRIIEAVAPFIAEYEQCSCCGRPPTIFGCEDRECPMGGEEG